MFNFIFQEFIIQELHEFVSDYDFNKFLNVSTKFKEYKKRYFYWELNTIYSLMYYSDNDFYTLMNTNISNENKQISIILCNTIITEDIGKRLSNVNKLDLSWCDDITDDIVKHLGNVHTLDLMGCNITNDVLEYLVNVHTLNISCCKITDEGLKYLGNVHTLDLCGCSDITNEGVKLLGKCHTLNLGYLIKITDECLVSLGNVKKLSLYQTFINEYSRR